MFAASTWLSCSGSEAAPDRGIAGTSGAAGSAAGAAGSPVGGGGKSSGVSGGSGVGGDANEGGSGVAGSAGSEQGGAGGGFPMFECGATPSLACGSERLLVGAAVNVDALATPDYRAVLAHEFNYITPENATKWGPLQPAAGTWDFAAADALIAEARSHGQRVKGHALVWHTQMPTWATALTGTDLTNAVKAHVETTVEHFRGAVYAWDVVNEAMADDAAGLRPGLHSTLGVEGLANAFKWARAADPDAELYYNDYGIEGINAKSDAVLALVAALQTAGAPIDGVGFQAHVSTHAYPSAAMLQANIARFAALGLTVNISELDVRTLTQGGSKQQRWASQAVAYRELGAACSAEPACAALTLWGFTDAYSWVDSAFGADDPLPFDEEYSKKPAYVALAGGLAGTPPVASGNLATNGACETAADWIAFGGGTLGLVAGRTGMACRVSGRTAAYQSPGLPLTGKIPNGSTINVSAYARLSEANAALNISLKKVEPGVADDYRGLDIRRASNDGWVLLSGNFALSWATAPTELVVYFDSAAAGGTFADILVDDVTVTVISEP